MISTQTDNTTTASLDPDPICADDYTDEQLLLAYRESGRPELFETLVHRYECELYNYLRRYLADAEMAEDAFQGTFLQVHLKSDQFQEGRRVRPWLYTIATNQAIDAQRRNKRHQLVSLDRTGGEDPEVGTLIDLLISAEPNPHDQSDTDEQREALRKALCELPESFRQVVILVYYQGLKYREAADVLSIPVGTIKSRLHSALVKLSEALHRTRTE